MHKETKKNKKKQAQDNATEPQEEAEPERGEELHEDKYIKKQRTINIQRKRTTRNMLNKT